MTAYPCFAPCGQPACRALGCIRVYNDRHQSWDECGNDGKQHDGMTAATCAERYGDCPHVQPAASPEVQHGK